MSKKTTYLKSLLNDTGLVGLFVGGWLALDGIVYLIPSEAATGVVVVLLAATLRVVVKAGR